MYVRMCIFNTAFVYANQTNPSPPYWCAVCSNQTHPSPLYWCAVCSDKFTPPHHTGVQCVVTKLTPPHHTGMPCVVTKLTPPHHTGVQCVVTKLTPPHHTGVQCVVTKLTPPHHTGVQCVVTKLTPPRPTGVAFPKNFLTIAKTILKRLFRVYAHIYHAHFSDIISLSEEAHLNTSFKHFIFFIQVGVASGCGQRVGVQSNCVPISCMFLLTSGI